jgi:SnoaL-like domain
MSNTELPIVISTYQDAHDKRDTDTALATFATDATVVDEGNTYTGSERIGWWLEHAASEFTFTRTLLSVEDLGDGDHVVRNHLAGNFPGGEADLNYRFRLRDGLIEHLEIAL